MNAKDFTKNVITNSLKDIKVDLDEEFDRNFERKAFFSSANAWAKKKYDDGKGTLLVRTGALRRSISSRVSGDQLVYSSSEVYATIHNEGGEIVVTEKMKKFFWYQFLLIEGSKTDTKDRDKLKEKYEYKKDGNKRNNKRNEKLSAAAEFYKSMALKKAGDKIIIPKRQFIGESPEVNRIITEIVEINVKEFFDKLGYELNAK